MASSAIGELSIRAVTGSSAPGEAFKVVDMTYPLRLLALLVIALAPELSAAQASYQVVSVQDGGTIKGTVKWQGAVPRLVPSEVNRDPQVCDPLGQKARDLEWLLAAPNRGVANTNVCHGHTIQGKENALPAVRRV